MRLQRQVNEYFAYLWTCMRVRILTSIHPNPDPDPNLPLPLPLPLTLILTLTRA